MKTLECPAELTREDRNDWRNTLVFVGGGITGCPDWQKEMIARFAELDDQFMLFNPRRANFDVTDPSMSAAQIDWEAKYLVQADAIIFWFPYHTLCPITLFELGKYAAQGKKLFVGCHPAYTRKFDVEHQLKLFRPDVVVHDNFTPLVEEIRNWYTGLEFQADLSLVTSDGC